MRRRPLTTYFVLCYLGTWTFAGVMLLAPELTRRWLGPPSVVNPAFLLAVYVPSVVGIVLTARYDGRAGLRALFTRLDPRRGGGWAIGIAGVFLAAGVAGGWGATLFGSPRPAWHLAQAPVVLGASLLLGPIGEEFGWRGFALPRLLERTSPITASLVLGVIWGIWHLPAFLIPGLPQAQFNFPAFVIGTVVLSIIMTWGAIRSGQSLLVAITAHLMANTVGIFTGVSFPAFNAALAVVALLLVMAGQLRRRSPKAGVAAAGVFGLVTLGGVRAVAQTADPHAVQPERPTVATHAGVVAPGWLEIETGFERDRFSDRSIAVGFPTIAKIGLAPRLQLSLQLPLSSPADESLGLGDLGAGLKWRLADDLPILREFAVLPSIKLPSGRAAAGRGTGTTDLSLLLVSSRTVGRLAIDLNVGVTRRSGDGTRAPKTASVWTASFGLDLGGPWGWVAEVFGYPGTSGPAGSAATVALLTGPTLALRPSVALDLGLIAPLAGPQPRAIYAGLVWNVGRLWKR